MRPVALAARVAGALGVAFGLLFASRPRSPPTPSTRPTRAGCRSRSTSSARRPRSPCRSSSSSSATSGRSPPDLTAEGHLPPALDPAPAPGHRDRRLGLDHRPGHRRRLERRRRRDAVPVGLRLGRPGHRVRGHRAGLAVPRPVLDDPRLRRRDPAGAARPGLGGRRLPGPLRSLAGDHRLRLLRLARARRPGRTVDPVHRARRLHRADGRDDGPVRARRMALPGRDVHRLVPDCSAGSPTGASSTRTAGS